MPCPIILSRAFHTEFVKLIFSSSVVNVAPFTEGRCVGYIDRCISSITKYTIVKLSTKGDRTCTESLLERSRLKVSFLLLMDDQGISTTTEPLSDFVESF
jgi:hypothetical protein